MGCRLCMLMCPIGSITYTADQMLKCEHQCMQSPDDEPACVKSCEKNCLSVVDVKDFATGLQTNFELDNSMGSASPRPLSPSGELAVSTEGLCVFCGTCEIVCPTNAIKIVDSHAEIDKSKCIMCGSCTAACPVLIPTGAGSIWDPRTIAGIRYTSKAGKYVLRGFGTERRLPNFDEIIIIPGQATVSPWTSTGNHVTLR